MNRFNRIYALHRCLGQARRPVSRRRLEEQLECSTATVKRIIQDMRDTLGAPIEYDREHNGYYYRRLRPGEAPYELPGVWFRPDELHALLTAQHLLSRLQPGLFGNLLAPLRGGIQRALEAGAGKGDEVARRVRVLSMAARQLDSGVFTLVADALLARRRLQVDYDGRARQGGTERELSPLRLVHYRENWYLDAWCHRAGDLRMFSVDRIRSVRVLNSASHEVSDAELDRRLAGSYGIFGGEPTDIAIVRFDASAARWVADECWHPEQQTRWLEDGRFELRLPYGQPTELVRDLLRWMPECEVVGPPALRTRVAEVLHKAAARYGDTG